MTGRTSETSVKARFGITPIQTAQDRQQARRGAAR